MARRLVISGGTVVSGDGSVGPASVIVSDGFIETVEPGEVRIENAEVVDATGSVVLPGIVNAHAHGCTTGPLFSSGAEALTGAVARANLDRHLAAGVTTVVNVCGFGLPDSTIPHTVDLRLATNHLPSAFVAAGLVDGASLGERERMMTVDAMVDAGAVMIGEVGSGATLGGGVAAYRYVPAAVRDATGIDLDPATATTLIDALTGPLRIESPDDARLRTAITVAGLPPDALGVVRRAILDFAVAPVRSSLLSFTEAVAAAERTGVPAMFHAAGPSAPELLRLARHTDATLIAGHLNHPSIPVEQIVDLARDLRDAGVVVDVSSLDMVHARRLTSPEAADVLAREGLVDTLSTDYAGGAWEPMLAVAERWHRLGYVGLEHVALMCSTRPAQVLGLTDRGSIARGLRADLVVVDADDLEAVRHVMSSGEIVYAAADRSAQP